MSRSCISVDTRPPSRGGGSGILALRDRRERDGHHWVGRRYADRGDLLDDRFPFRTLIAGSQAQFAPSREIGLEPLTVSSSVFSALQITVVPEPTTALLMALGLLGLSRLGRKV